MVWEEEQGVSGSNAPIFNYPLSVFSVSQFYRVVLGCGGRKGQKERDFLNKYNCNTHSL